MKLYLAGPMSGHESYNYPLFNKVAKELRLNGFDIANPAETGESVEEIGKSEYSVYMRAGLKMLLGCTGIILMTGWETSMGCLTELYVATACDLKVYFYDVRTGTLTNNNAR